MSKEPEKKIVSVPVSNMKRRFLALRLGISRALRPRRDKRLMGLCVVANMAVEHAKRMNGRNRVFANDSIKWSGIGVRGAVLCRGYHGSFEGKDMFSQSYAVEIYGASAGCVELNKFIEAYIFKHAGVRVKVYTDW